MESVTLPLALFAGIVAFLSPCFLPIVPVFCASLTGGGQARRSAIVANVAAFIAGFTAVFTLLWASIGLIGYLLGDQRGLLRIVGGALLIVMGLHTAGLVRLPFLDRRVGARMPVANRAARSSAPAPRTVVTTGSNGSSPAPISVPTATSTTSTTSTATSPSPHPSLRRSTVLGAGFAAGWTPCIGPVLGGVLGLATASETVGRGSLLMVAFGIGLGIPLLLAALGTNAFAGRFSWLTRHRSTLSLVNGAVLLIIGFLMITDQFGRLAGLIPALGI